MAPYAFRMNPTLSDAEIASLDILSTSHAPTHQPQAALSSDTARIEHSPTIVAQLEDMAFDYIVIGNRLLCSTHSWHDAKLLASRWRDSRVSGRNKVRACSIYLMYARKLRMYRLAERDGVTVCVLEAGTTHVNDILVVSQHHQDDYNNID